MNKRRLLIFGIISSFFLFTGIVLSHFSFSDSTFFPNSAIGDIFVILAINFIIYMLYDIPALSAVTTAKRLEILAWTTLALAISYILYYLIIPDSYYRNIFLELFIRNISSEYFFVTFLIFTAVAFWVFIVIQLFGLIMIKRKPKTHYLFWSFLALLNAFMFLNSQTGENPFISSISIGDGAEPRIARIVGYFLIFTIVFNSYRNAWVNYLNKTQKLTSLFVGVVLLILLILLRQAPMLNIQGFLNTYSVAAGSFFFVSNIFLIIYVLMAVFSLLLHLPTAGIFDKKVKQIASLSQLSSAVTSIHYDELLDLITDQTLEIVDADSAWFMERTKENDSYRLHAMSSVGKQQHKLIKDGKFDRIVTGIEQSNDPVIISDIYRDTFFSLDREVRVTGGSLIGVSLHVQSEGMLGVLFAWKRTEYGFDYEDKKMMQIYSNQAAVAIQNNVLLEESIEKERMQQELKVARDIQLKLLPKEIPDMGDGIRIEASSLPAFEVGGDYYDFVQLNERLWGVFIGDVSGKGVSAAFYMAEIKGFIQSLARIYHSPKDLLIKVNEALFGNIERKSFISMLAAVIDLKKKKLTFTRAGHCPLAFFDPEKDSWQLLSPKGLGLGLDRGNIFDSVIEEKTVKFKPGCKFFLYTDGATEAFNKKGEEFGKNRLLTILDKCQKNDVTEYVKAVLDEIHLFSENQTMDDITMIVIHIGESTDQK